MTETETGSDPVIPTPRLTADEVLALVQQVEDDKRRLLVLADRLLGLVLDVSDALLLGGEVPAELRAALDDLAWQVREGGLSIDGAT